MALSAKWPVVVLAMLMLQVLAVLSQTYVIENSKSASNTNSSEFDRDYFEHTHPVESAISIESSLGDGGNIEVVVSAAMEAQISLELTSLDILDMPFARHTKLHLNPGQHFSFIITKFPIQGDVDLPILAIAISTESYHFWQQHTFPD